MTPHHCHLTWHWMVRCEGDVLWCVYSFPVQRWSHLYLYMCTQLLLSGSFSTENCTHGSMHFRCLGHLGRKLCKCHPHSAHRSRVEKEMQLGPSLQHSPSHAIVRLQLQTRRRHHHTMYVSVHLSFELQKCCIQPLAQFIQCRPLPKVSFSSLWWPVGTALHNCKLRPQHQKASLPLPGCSEFAMGYFQHNIWVIDCLRIDLCVDCWWGWIMSVITAGSPMVEAPINFCTIS